MPLSIVILSAVEGSHVCVSTAVVVAPPPSSFLILLRYFLIQTWLTIKTNNYEIAFLSFRCIPRIAFRDVVRAGRILSRLGSSGSAGSRSNRPVRSQVISGLRAIGAGTTITTIIIGSRASGSLRREWVCFGLLRGGAGKTERTRLTRVTGAECRFLRRHQLRLRLHRKRLLGRTMEWKQLPVQHRCDARE